jgi:hypothetical protein
MVHPSTMVTHLCHRFGREQRPGGGPFETKGLEKPLFWIRNHGKGDVEPFFECRRLLDAAQPNQHHCRTHAIKGIFFAAQLRHLFAAKRSAVMPQKNQHQWRLTSITQGHRMSPAVFRRPVWRIDIPEKALSPRLATSGIRFPSRPLPRSPLCPDPCRCDECLL